MCRASIIIIARNEGELLAKTVRSCAESIDESVFEIVVVDDQSSDGWPARVAREFPSVQLEVTARQEGVAQSRNIGARRSQGETLIFLDAHCRSQPGALQQLVADVEESGGASVVTPAICGLDPTTWTRLDTRVGNGYGVDLLTGHTGWVDLADMRQVGHFFESPNLIGCCLAVGRDLFERLGRFDHQMWPWGVEDVDFGLKVWMAGHAILHDPRLLVAHRFQRRFSAIGPSCDDYLANQILCARKHLCNEAYEAWLCHARCVLGDSQLARSSLRLRERCVGGLPSTTQWRDDRKLDEFAYARRFGLAWPGEALASLVNGGPSGGAVGSLNPRLRGDPKVARVHGKAKLSSTSWLRLDLGLRRGRNGSVFTYQTKCRVEGRPASSDVALRLAALIDGWPVSELRQNRRQFEQLIVDEHLHGYLPALVKALEAALAGT